MFETRRGQFRQQFLIIRLVVGVGAGKARRADPGSSSQRFHDDPGIVCEYRTFDEDTVMERLFVRVGFKRQAVFDARRKGLNAGELFNRDPMPAGCLPKFSEFSRVGRRQDKSQGYGSRSPRGRAP